MNWNWSEVSGPPGNVGEVNAGKGGLAIEADQVRDGAAQRSVEVSALHVNLNELNGSLNKQNGSSMDGIDEMGMELMKWEWVIIE